MNAKGVRETSERQQSSGVKVTKNRLSSQARRLLQVNPHTVQHARTRAATSYAGESMFVRLKTTTVAAEVKAEALWELLWPQLLRLDTDVSTGITSVLHNADTDCESAA